MNQSRISGKSWKDGGAEGNRTPDLHVANVALSQLSYGPIIFDSFMKPLPLPVKVLRRGLFPRYLAGSHALAPPGWED